MSKNDDPLLETFKKHIEFEDGMDDSMLNNYLKAARRYVRVATGKEPAQPVMMVAAILYDFRVPEGDMSKALDSMTPILLAEVFADEEIDEQSET